MNNPYNMNMTQIYPVNYHNNMQKRLARLKKEFQLCDQDDELMQIGCSFGLCNNDISIWRVTMLGPKNTPYEGGIFTIKIYFPLEYPSLGPEFKFTNKIYHLNVDPKNDVGHISLKEIKEWRICGKVTGRPIYGLTQAIFDILCLFYDQNILDAYDEKMALQYRDNREKFNKIAKEWTENYAKLKQEYWL